uniref:Core-binding (CB) domain-containing protein n=1 Tax=Steinernema glaseri TaxID=37863 RepID=A0A1I7YCC7_9BILA
MKPMGMTERDLKKLQMKSKTLKWGGLTETTSSSSSRNAIDPVSMNNWKGKLAEFDFPMKDLDSLETAARESDQCPTYKREAFQWIRENRSSLLTDTETTAKYYKLAFHDTYLQSLKAMIEGGMITQKEFDNSPDIARLLRSSERAQISVHSVSSLVKKISRERLTGIKA